MGLFKIDFFGQDKVLEKIYAKFGTNLALFLLKLQSSQ